MRRGSLWHVGLAATDRYRRLTGLDPLKICVAYELRGTRYDEIPPGRHLLEKVKPVYEEFRGWKEDITHARSLSELPVTARRYLDRVAELSGVKLAMVGVGAAREATIVIENPFLA